MKKKVLVHYRSGLHCAEVVARTILETFSSQDHTQTIRTAAGFGGGVAGSMQGLCGAYTGGIIAVGALLGRNRPGDDLRDCAAIVNDYTERFADRFGSCQCMEVLERFDGGPPMACIKLTVEAAQLLGDILWDWEDANGIKLSDAMDIPRDAIGLGQCPFSSARANSCDATTGGEPQ